jgi:hypothetical protein
MDRLERSAIEEEASVDERLQNVKKLVQKATQEAFQSSLATAGNFVENDDPNASFHLGMELFGHEPSVIEKKLQDKLATLERDVQEVLDTLSEAKGSGETLEAELSAYQTPQELEGEAAKLRAKIAFLQECSEARKALDESITLASPAISNANEDLVQATTHLMEAQRHIQQARTVLEEQEVAQGATPALTLAHRMMDEIKLAIRRHKVDILGRVKSTWIDCVTLTSTSLVVRNTTDLATAYDVMEILAAQGDLTRDALLRKFTKSLLQDVWRPLLERHRSGGVREPWTTRASEDSPRPSTVQVVSNRQKGTTWRLEWERDDDTLLIDLDGKEPPTSTVADWKGTFLFLQTVSVFVAQHVLQLRKPLCQWVGKCFFGKPDALPVALNLSALGLESCRIGDDNGMLMEPLMEILAETTIPEYLGPDEMSPKLDEISAELDSFIGPFLRDLLRVQMVGPENTRLDKFVALFEQKYVDNRRCILLNKARELLLHNDYHNTIQVGVEIPDFRNDNTDVDDGMAVFMLHKSSISETAAKLMSLCRNVMDEVVEQKPSTSESPLGLLPATLYRAAREILDLFRAIIPTTHAGEIHNVPRTAAVLHNDGVFFAHHCLALGLEYKREMSALYPNDTQAQLISQSFMFADLVPLFRNMADRAMKDMISRQADQLVELVEPRITYLGTALQSDEVLAEFSDAEQAFEAGVYHLRHLVHAWKPVLSKDVLNRSICYLADIMFTLYLDQLAKASNISENATHFVNNLFRQASMDIIGFLDGDHSASRVWDRFTAIGIFMEMSLSDIQVALSEGVFLSVTGQELTRLVKATFDDSPKRRHLLALLSS